MGKARAAPEAGVIMVQNGSEVFGAPLSAWFCSEAPFRGFVPFRAQHMSRPYNNYFEAPLGTQDGKARVKGAQREARQETGRSKGSSHVNIP
jgi:hypothetical protein